MVRSSVLIAIQTLGRIEVTIAFLQQQPQPPAKLKTSFLSEDRTLFLTADINDDGNDEGHSVPPDFSILEEEEDSVEIHENHKSSAKMTDQDTREYDDDDDKDGDDKVDGNDLSRDDDNRYQDDDRGESFYEESTRYLSSRRRPVGRRGKKSLGRASWMKRNEDFSKSSERADAVSATAEEERRRPPPKRRKGGSPSRKDDDTSHREDDSYRDRSRDDDNNNRTFRQDFRGTRVFVQGLPPAASWQDVKDHFRIAGEVVFASVSTDPVTGKSKECGIVQYETTEMAQAAVAVMRDHPLDGYRLYVREDYQEKDEGGPFRDRMPRGAKRGPTPPSKWKCADEDSASYLSDEDLKAIRSLIKARDDARRRRKYEASDNMREDLKRKFGVHVDDRLKMWWISYDGHEVPQSVQSINGPGRWGDRNPWRQIPTTPENDARVNPDLVNALLLQRDAARREHDFSTADALLEEARTSPDGDLNLRIHDESRTWRIWTDEPPPRPVRRQANTRRSAAEQCIDLVEEYAPEKVDEVRTILQSFPGREYKILKKLKKRYTKTDAG